MISEGYLRRHVSQYRGTGDAMAIGLLDVAQTYLLEAVRVNGFFDNGLVFKGGTALRKFYLGTSGRFSTDMDFAVAPSSSLVEDLLLWLSENVEFHDVIFRLELEGNTRGNLKISTSIGDSTVPSIVEISTRKMWLPVSFQDPVEFAFHSKLEFTPAPCPIADLHEMLGEKLAAIWRRQQARDVYDLVAMGGRPLDEDLLRRITYLKVYADVEEGISRGPFDGGELLDRKLGEVSGWGDIGLLSSPPDEKALTAALRSRYRFLRYPDNIEAVLARTSLSDKSLAQECINQL